MKAFIKKSNLGGNCFAPPSKSSMQRALAAALVCKGYTMIRNPGKSKDDEASIGVISELGCEVKRSSEGVEVISKGIDPQTNIIDCGESGLGVRMFLPLIALSNKEIKVTGEGSLLQRPMNFFNEILPLLGVRISSGNGRLPITVRGPLQPQSISIDGSLSSQFLTGLLFAYSAARAENVAIHVKELKSKPYVDLTLAVMKHFGMNIPVNDSYSEFRFLDPITKIPDERTYEVEGDWSNGAFLLVAGAIAGTVRLHGLDTMSAQADKSILDALMLAEARLAIEAKGLVIHRGGLKGFIFDATDSPDLFPPLVALAAFCDGYSRISGVHRLVNKESDRATSLVEEFRKMNVDIKVINDEMIIEGNPAGISSARVNGHNDHRIVMALAVAALGTEGETQIDGAEAINKSYPEFFWHLKKLGAEVSVNKYKFIHE